MALRAKSSAVASRRIAIHTSEHPTSKRAERSEHRFSPHRLKSEQHRGSAGEHKNNHARAELTTTSAPQLDTPRPDDDDNDDESDGGGGVEDMTSQPVSYGSCLHV